MEGRCRDQFRNRKKVFRELSGILPKSRILVPSVGHNNDKPRHGADDMRIKKDAEGRKQSLFTGMIVVCCGGTHGDGPLAGFV